MAGYISKRILKINTLLFIVWLSVAHGFPPPLSNDDMIHNNNYDMVMADDHAPAESMQYQNFDEFYNAELNGNTMSEMEMEESRGSSKVQPPQPLSEMEKHLREHFEVFDVIREKRNQKLLSKGSSEAREHNHDWDQFDYDAHVSTH